MTLSERRAQILSYSGRDIVIEIDRPVGYCHTKNGNTWVYPINYGYIPGVFGGDGEELDVYLLGVTEPLTRAECHVIGAVLRDDDDEDKLIAAPCGMTFSIEQMEAAVHFQEQYHISHVVVF